MKIKSIRARPLYLKLKKPYYWAQGTNLGTQTILVEIEDEDGNIGYGESLGIPNCELVVRAIDDISEYLKAKPAEQIGEICAYVHQSLFASQGPGNHRRLSSQVIAGVEMALWDLLGKQADKPVHQLLGGARREFIQYFGFAQGGTAEELADDAERYRKAGFETVYIKIGRGHEKDLESVAAVRDVIGDGRLRADANESWDMLTARQMIARLSSFNLEMIEQPVDSSAIAALAQLRNSVSTPIAADQAVHTIQDVYEVCRLQAADLIVLGLHECGGIINFIKAASIAEAAGLNLCIHGNFESSITTCAAHQAGLVIPNLDDANQIMGHFLEEDLIAADRVTPSQGRLGAIQAPGLGFELDYEAVDRAAESYRQLQR